MENYTVQCIQDLVPIEDSLRLGLACVADTGAAFPGTNEEQAGSVSVSRLTPGQADPFVDSTVLDALSALVRDWGADMVEIGRRSGKYVLLPQED